MSSLSTLSGEATVLTRLNHGRSDRYPCPHAKPSTSDCYDQAPGEYACKDETGRRRKRHEYLIQARDGARCLWCGRRRTWEPI